MSRLGVFGVFLIFMQACQSDIVYNTYQTVEDANWKHNQEMQFEINLKDTINTYNLFINIRNNKDYKYSNLFLITEMTFPNQVKVVDTLEYEMTNSEGRFLGSGFSDLKENKLFYKENVRFNASGKYLFEVRQAMRKRNEVEGIELDGITDVGISIEKVK
ncbi:MAG TPA: gliding motility lipoprotein GldH [Lutibacter sp.]|nr:gliding motility lipoprotein GldH [Lutibacter sp.]